jgi:2-methylisocitrate lyase-like PEP mutase family enzyme
MEYKIHKASIMRQSDFSIFKQLHEQNEPLLLNNIWDPASAVIVQSNGAKALATSSAAMAWSLGYADGYQLPIKILISAVQRIQRVAKVPLSVDIENGYSEDVRQVAELAYELLKIGVVGINIEDGLGSSERLVKKIKAIKSKVGNNLFINARTDIYLQNIVQKSDQLNTTITRLKQYQQAGAHCGFIPGLAKVNDTQTLLEHMDMDMPINLMISGYQKELIQFADLGVQRLTLGPQPFLNAYSTLANLGQDSEAVKVQDYTFFNRQF